MFSNCVYADKAQFRNFVDFFAFGIKFYYGFFRRSKSFCLFGKFFKKFFDILRQFLFAFILFFFADKRKKSIYLRNSGSFLAFYILNAIHDGLYKILCHKEGNCEKHSKKSYHSCCPADYVVLFFLKIRFFR